MGAFHHSFPHQSIGTLWNLMRPPASNASVGTAPTPRSAFRASRNVLRRFHTGVAEGPEKRNFCLVALLFIRPSAFCLWVPCTSCAAQINHHRKHCDFVGSRNVRVRFLSGNAEGPERMKSGRLGG